MIRFLFKFIICLLLAAAVGVGLLALRSGDPFYTLHEWLSPARFQQYDQLIKRGVGGEPSRPDVGEGGGLAGEPVRSAKTRRRRRARADAGERNRRAGVGERASAGELSRRRIVRSENESRGRRWYLRRAMSHWQQMRDPIPFALAEYNAGPSRAQRWAGGDGARPISAVCFSATSISPGRRNTSNRSSSATISINGAGGCNSRSKDWARLSLRQTKVQVTLMFMRMIEFHERGFLSSRGDSVGLLRRGHLRFAELHLHWAFVYGRKQ